jgi:alpha-L-fucosidase
MIPLLALAVAAHAIPMHEVDPPLPFGITPTERQLAHADLTTYAFLHFSPNTFTNREWGNGDEDPNVFYPDHFDPDQIVGALRAGGFQGAILTAKHHDGFCLWPTKTTDHSIAKSSWRKGEGDVVRDIAGACKKHGLKFGVYLSPWDRSNADYGKPEYVTTYRKQLYELLSQYGPIFEVWHDGANGGSGYYGGAKETRMIDRRTYYGWPETWSMVRGMQGGANIFSDVGPDLRWVGNEEGVAAETCWATFTPVGEDGGAPAPGTINTATSPTGTRFGRFWVPAECDVSIRPGWFWHEAENSKVKTPAQLVDLYYKSVGRGAFFLLNVPPNNHGLIEPEDAAAIKAYHDIIVKTFAVNFAKGAKITASNVRGGDKRFAADNLLSERRDMYWTTDDSETLPSVELSLDGKKTFNVVRLREAIQLGQRIEGLSVDTWQDGAWKEIGAVTSIGNSRLLRLEHPVTTDRVRLRVTVCPVCPTLQDFGLFLEPGVG